MDNGEARSKFWKGVLVGALVMAFVGLIVVGVSAGIFLIGRSVIGNQIHAEADPGDTALAGENGEETAQLDLDAIGRKMEYIQDIVDSYFLYDEDPEKVEDGIYTGLMYGLEDPYAGYYNEEDFESLMEDTSGEFITIGFYDIAVINVDDRLGRCPFPDGGKIR